MRLCKKNYLQQKTPIWFVKRRMTHISTYRLYFRSRPYTVLSGSWIFPARKADFLYLPSAVDTRHETDVNKDETYRNADLQTCIKQHTRTPDQRLESWRKQQYPGIVQKVHNSFNVFYETRRKSSYCSSIFSFAFKVGGNARKFGGSKDVHSMRYLCFYHERQVWAVISKLVSDVAYPYEADTHFQNVE